MKSSPKVVAVDLFGRSPKKSKSPPRALPARQTGTGSDPYEFSFSKDKSPRHTENSKNKERMKVAKNLFNSSSQRAKSKAGATSHAPKWVKGNESRTHRMHRNSPERKSPENEDVFKRSVDKLKKTFFREVRNDRNLTIKTLKEIGKNAKRRA
jgi:hypothetical protein